MTRAADYLTMNSKKENDVTMKKLFGIMVFAALLASCSSKGGCSCSEGCASVTDSKPACATACTNECSSHS